MISPVLLFCEDTFLRTRDGADPFELILNSIEKLNVCLNLEASLKGGKQKAIGVARIENLHSPEKKLALIVNWIEEVYESVSRGLKDGK